MVIARSNRIPLTAVRAMHISSNFDAGNIEVCRGGPLHHSMGMRQYTCSYDSYCLCNLSVLVSEACLHSAGLSVMPQYLSGCGDWAIGPGQAPNPPRSILRDRWKGSLPMVQLPGEWGQGPASHAANSECRCSFCPILVLCQIIVLHGCNKDLSV